MNEINLNAMNRSLGIERALGSTANQKSAGASKPSAEPDSAEFSHLPDISTVDEAVEKEFSSRRASLQDLTDSPAYPPLETIDKLAAMLAIELRTDKK